MRQISHEQANNDAAILIERGRGRSRQQQQIAVSNCSNDNGNNFNHNGSFSSNPNSIDARDSSIGNRGNASNYKESRINKISSGLNSIGNAAMKKLKHITRPVKYVSNNMNEENNNDNINIFKNNNRSSPDGHKSNPILSPISGSRIRRRRYNLRKMKNMDKNDNKNDDSDFVVFSSKRRSAREIGVESDSDSEDEMRNQNKIANEATANDIQMSGATIPPNEIELLLDLVAKVKAEVEKFPLFAKVIIETYLSPFWQQPKREGEQKQEKKQKQKWEAVLKSEETMVRPTTELMNCHSKYLGEYPLISNELEVISILLEERGWISNRAGYSEMATALITALDDVDYWHSDDIKNHTTNWKILGCMDDSENSNYTSNEVQMMIQYIVNCGYDKKCDIEYFELIKLLLREMNLIEKMDLEFINDNLKYLVNKNYLFVEISMQFCVNSQNQHVFELYKPETSGYQLQSQIVRNMKPDVKKQCDNIILEMENNNSNNKINRNHFIGVCYESILSKNKHIISDLDSIFGGKSHWKMTNNFVPHDNPLQIPIEDSKAGIFDIKNMIDNMLQMVRYENIEAKDPKQVLSMVQSSLFTLMCLDFDNKYSLIDTILDRIYEYFIYCLISRSIGQCLEIVSLMSWLCVVFDDFYEDFVYLPIKDKSKDKDSNCERIVKLQETMAKGALVTCIDSKNADNKSVKFDKLWIVNHFLCNLEKLHCFLIQALKQVISSIERNVSVKNGRDGDSDVSVSKTLQKLKEYKDKKVMDQMENENLDAFEYLYKIRHDMESHCSSNDLTQVWGNGASKRWKQIRPQSEDFVSKYVKRIELEITQKYNYNELEQLSSQVNCNEFESRFAAIYHMQGTVSLCCSKQGAIGAFVNPAKWQTNMGLCLSSKQVNDCIDAFENKVNENNLVKRGSDGNNNDKKEKEDGHENEKSKKKEKDKEKEKPKEKIKNDMNCNDRNGNFIKDYFANLEKEVNRLNDEAKDNGDVNSGNRNENSNGNDNSISKNENGDCDYDFARDAIKLEGLFNSNTYWRCVSFFKSNKKLQKIALINLFHEYYLSNDKEYDKLATTDGKCDLVVLDFRTRPVVVDLHVANYPGEKQYPTLKDVITDDIAVDKACKQENIPHFRNATFNLQTKIVSCNQGDPTDKNRQVMMNKEDYFAKINSFGLIDKKMGFDFIFLSVASHANDRVYQFNRFERQRVKVVNDIYSTNKWYRVGVILNDCCNGDKEPTVYVSHQVESSVPSGFFSQFKQKQKDTNKGNKKVNSSNDNSNDNIHTNISNNENDNKHAIMGSNDNSNSNYGSSNSNSTSNSKSKNNGKSNSSNKNTSVHRQEEKMSSSTGDINTIVVDAGNINSNKNGNDNGKDEIDDDNGNGDGNDADDSETETERDSDETLTEEFDVIVTVNANKNNNKNNNTGTNDQVTKEKLNKLNKKFSDLRKKKLVNIREKQENNDKLSNFGGFSFDMGDGLEMDNIVNNTNNNNNNNTNNNNGEINNWEDVLRQGIIDFTPRVDINGVVRWMMKNNYSDSNEKTIKKKLAQYIKETGAAIAKERLDKIAKLVFEIMDYDNECGFETITATGREAKVNNDNDPNAPQTYSDETRDVVQKTEKSLAKSNIITIDANQRGRSSRGGHLTLEFCDKILPFINKPCGLRLPKIIHEYKPMIEEKSKQTVSVVDDNSGNIIVMGKEMLYRLANQIMEKIFTFENLAKDLDDETRQVLFMYDEDVQDDKTNRQFINKNQKMYHDIENNIMNVMYKYIDKIPDYVNGFDNIAQNKGDIRCWVDDNNALYVQEKPYLLTHDTIECIHQHNQRFYPNLFRLHSIHNVFIVEAPSKAIAACIAAYHETQAYRRNVCKTNSPVFFRLLIGKRHRHYFEDLKHFDPPQKYASNKKRDNDNNSDKNNNSNTKKDNKDDSKDDNDNDNDDFMFVFSYETFARRNYDSGDPLGFIEGPSYASPDITSEIPPIMQEFYRKHDSLMLCDTQKDCKWYKPHRAMGFCSDITNKYLESLDYVTYMYKDGYLSRFDRSRLMHELNLRKELNEIEERDDTLNVFCSPFIKQELERAMKQDNNPLSRYVNEKKISKNIGGMDLGLIKPGQLFSRKSNVTYQPGTRNGKSGWLILPICGKDIKAGDELWADNTYWDAVSYWMRFLWQQREDYPFAVQSLKRQYFYKCPFLDDLPVNEQNITFLDDEEFFDSSYR